MANSITSIQKQMNDTVRASTDGLSASKVSEWSLITYVVAAAINAFEVILDLFRTEVEDKTANITAGTVAWYAEMARRFQYQEYDRNDPNHSDKVNLRYDPATGCYGYPIVDPSLRIIRVVSVDEVPDATKAITVKVAKQEDGRILPLSRIERNSFEQYIKELTMAGIRVNAVSQLPDTVKYSLTVWHDTTYSAGDVYDNVLTALDQFRDNLSFNAIFYRQQFIDAVMHAPGVVTVTVNSLEHRFHNGEGSATDQSQYEDAGNFVRLMAGYFDYEEIEEGGSVLTVLPVGDIIR